MKSDLRLPNPNPCGPNAGRGFDRAILRLVKGGPERMAIEAGQIDAVVYPASGIAILLPDPRRNRKGYPQTGGSSEGRIAGSW